MSHYDDVREKQYFDKLDKDDAYERELDRVAEEIESNLFLAGLDELAEDLRKIDDEIFYKIAEVRVGG